MLLSILIIGETFTMGAGRAWSTWHWCWLWVVDLFRWGKFKL